jgi:photosystem II stability/assembly factor-like uncharacterized protein
MKTIIRFIPIFLLFSTSHLFTQWYMVSSGNGTRDLNSIHFSTPATGYAVGDSGYVRKSTNTGTVWNSLTINTTANLRKVQAFGTNLAYICGDQGVIFKTINDGVSWNAINPAGTFNYYGMDFINNNTGIVVGQQRRFAYTANGGTNWITGVLNTAGLNNLDIVSVDMVDNSTIYVGTSDTLISGQYRAYVYKSTNSGVDFTLSATTSSINLRSNFIDIQFLNNNTGFALSQNNFIHKTTNGGTNWSPALVLYTARSIHFVNAFTGYACGVNGQLRKTTDSGMNWLQQNSPTTLTMNSNYFVDSVTGYAAGFDGFIMKTGNGGTYTGINQIGHEVPEDFQLHQNYPNPFNPSTKISFDIPASLHVKLTVYDILGNEIRVLLNNDMNGGKYETQFEASELPSGTYFYRFEAGIFTQTKKMILIK